MTVSFKISAKQKPSERKATFIQALSLGRGKATKLVHKLEQLATNTLT